MCILARIVGRVLPGDSSPSQFSRKYKRRFHKDLVQQKVSDLH